MSEGGETAVEFITIKKKNRKKSSTRRANAKSHLSIDESSNAVMKQP